MKNTSIISMERNLDWIYSELKNFLKKYAKGALVGRRAAISSKFFSGTKPAYYLNGKRVVSILGRKPEQILVAGIIMQKHFVGFYSMPLYSHPKEVPLKHPLLKKMNKGKSCINVNKLDSDMLAELDEHVKKGIALYKKLGWI